MSGHAATFHRQPPSSAAAWIRQLAMPAMLALIWLTFAAMAPQFLSPRNLSNLLIEASITATLATGVLLVLLPGHTDLSTGSGAGLLGGLAAILIHQHHWPAPLALAAGLTVGIAIYYGSGKFIVKLRVQSFIVTLAGLLIFKGLFWYITGSRTIPVTSQGQENALSQLTAASLTPRQGYGLLIAVLILLALLARRSRLRAQRHQIPAEPAEHAFLNYLIAAQGLALIVVTCNQHRGLPVSFLLLASVATAVHVLTRHTPWGRWLYAIGGNQEAAHLAGVPVERVLVTAFALLGAITALTGFMATSYTGASTTTTGELMELDAIAACVIGGASLKGGRGTVMGALIGALIMVSLLNGMALLAVRPEIKLLARGLVLLLAVALDARLSRHRPA